MMRYRHQQQHRLLLLLMVVVVILITKLVLLETKFWNPALRRTLLLNNSLSSKQILLHRDDVDFSQTSFDDESYHRSHSDSHSHSRLLTFQSSKHFLYLHRPTKTSTAGLNNQLQCIHLAANLALEYNRTLLLPDKAFQADKVRFHRTVDFGDVFDDGLESLPIRVKLVNSITRSNRGTTLKNTADPFEDPSSPYYNCLDNTQRIEKYHRPDDSTQQRSPLGYEYEKNHSMLTTTKCVSFHCGWGQLHLSAPKQRFPYIDMNLLPLNPSYVRIADRILSTMVSDKSSRQPKQQQRRNIISVDDEDSHDVNLSLRSPTTTTSNVLAIHIRGGDSCGYPVTDCAKTSTYPYLVVSKNINKGTRWGAFCSRTPGENKNTTESLQQHVGDEKDILTWGRFLLHFVTCDGQIPDLCIDDYDAVYIATNDDRYKSSSVIQKMLNTTTTTNVNATATQLTKLYFLQDFDFVEEELKRSFISPKIDDTGGIDNNEKKDGVKSKRRSRLRLHPLHYFLLEEAILSRATKFQSSVPSSVSDIVYHYRQEMGYQHDVDMYSVWDAMEMELLASQSKDRS